MGKDTIYMHKLTVEVIFKVIFDYIFSFMVIFLFVSIKKHLLEKQSKKNIYKLQ